MNTGEAFASDHKACITYIAKSKAYGSGLPGGVPGGLLPPLRRSATQRCVNSTYSEALAGYNLGVEALQANETGQAVHIG